MSRVYVINGEPTPLARARHSNETKRVYDSQKAIKMLAGIGLRSQHDDEPFLTGPLHLDVTFFMEKTLHSKAKTTHHIFKPDLDNMIKYVCDVSAGIIFEDDRIIAKITATKKYDHKPRTEFMVIKIQE
jgi:Holliday junction resolvase RusA-like endonuclease